MGSENLSLRRGGKLSYKRGEHLPQWREVADGSPHRYGSDAGELRNLAELLGGFFDHPKSNPKIVADWFIYTKIHYFLFFKKSLARGTASELAGQAQMSLDISF